MFKNVGKRFFLDYLRHSNVCWFEQASNTNAPAFELSNVLKDRFECFLLVLHLILSETRIMADDRSVIKNIVRKTMNSKN